MIFFNWYLNCALLRLQRFYSFSRCLMPFGEGMYFTENTITIYNVDTNQDSRFEELYDFMPGIGNCFDVKAMGYFQGLT